MKQFDKWVALYSQTGSEIVNLTNALKSVNLKGPDIILTNSATTTSSHRSIYIKAQRRSHDELMSSLRTFDPETTLITLHGYLRIIPADVCETYYMLNGHPAPLHIYPKLKGKDMQEEQFNQRATIKRIGSVIHRVTPELDSGEIIVSADIPNNCKTLEETYMKLKATSLQTWVSYFTQMNINRTEL